MARRSVRRASPDGRLGRRRGQRRGKLPRRGEREEAGARRVPLVRRRQQLRRPDARCREVRGQGAGRARSPSSTQPTTRRSSSRSCRRRDVEAVRRDHRPAHLRAAADPRDQVRRSRSGIKVVNIDQILGTNPGTAAPPVPGLSGNVVFVQTADRPEAGRPRRRRLRRAERRTRARSATSTRSRSPRSTPRSARASTRSTAGHEHQGRRRGRDVLQPGERAQGRADDAPGAARHERDRRRRPGRDRRRSRR